MGLGAGDIMVGANFNYQFIDWRHDPIADEDFHHLGTLSAVVISPSITIGITDWWNISLSQVLGNRYMIWDADDVSKHHRDEGSESNFDNAIGGYLGDTRIMLRYLALNAGKGPGPRLFVGGGLVAPSKNTLTSDPFFLGEEDIVVDHRHFSMSEGLHKAVFETQYFIKRIRNPVFYGGTFIIEEPLWENDHGFKGSRLIDLSFTASTNQIKPLRTSFSGTLMVRRTEKAYWNGEVAPNSESTLLIPGVGMSWNMKFAAIMLNIQKPIFLQGSVSGGAYLDEETDVWQISMSMRKILDYYIPWLYW